MDAELESWYVTAVTPAPAVLVNVESPLLADAVAA